MTSYRTNRLTLLATALCLGSAVRCFAVATPAQINDAFGIALLSAMPFFEEDATAVAKRLGLKNESTTEYGAIWRGSPARFAHFDVPEIRLFGTQNSARELSVNLINKGDFFSRDAILKTAKELDPTGRRYRRGVFTGGRIPPKINGAMTRRFKQSFADRERRIATMLTRLFGESRNQVMRQDRRRRVQRWDWEAAAFLLDKVEGDFLIVRLLSSAKADKGGRAERISDGIVRSSLRDNVTQRENGDVMIMNVPMVNQGEKGYCGVASAERVLRYFAIPVDSHQLANLTNTDKFGGTEISELETILSAITRRHKRRFDRLGSDLKMTSVKRRIDNGIPILWGMYLTPAIEQAVKNRQAHRPDYAPQEWREILRTEYRTMRRVKANHYGGHLRLILGYNDLTREIAYSDSWGSQTDVFWISEAEARKITIANALFVIVP